MFTVDEPTAEAIRRAFNEGGELSGIVEFKRHFPLITDNAKAGECVRIIAGWTSIPPEMDQRAQAPNPGWPRSPAPPPTPGYPRDKPEEDNPAESESEKPPHVSWRNRSPR